VHAASLRRQRHKRKTNADPNLIINGHTVDCEGNETAIANLDAEILSFAKAAEMSPDDVARNVLLAFSGWSADPSEREMQTKILLYYALSLKTEHPVHPGKIRDYAPVYDFKIEISVTGRKVHVKMLGAAWPDA
jgi:hypothetical protein